MAQSLVRRLNRSAVLDLVREEGPISRTAIASQLRISLSTVVRIIDQLNQFGLVQECGDTESTRGRPRSLVEFNAGASAVVGVDLSRTEMYGSVANLGGEILEEICQAWDAGDAPDQLDDLYRLIDRLLEAPRPPGQTIRGIGIGAPGVTFTEQGIVSWAPSLGWRDLPLKQILEARYGLPAIVENDVNLAALGEYGFGVAKGASSLVCITIGTGIGAGIIIDRKIYRGFHHSAGEIGYLPPNISYLGQRCDEFGALESITSESGIAARGRYLLWKYGLPLPTPELTAEDVFKAAQDGERWAQQTVDETVDHLSFAISAVCTLLDPEFIVLRAGIDGLANGLIDPILNRLEGLVPIIPHLVQSTLGFRATVLGAILLVLDETTEHLSIERLG